MNSEQLYLEIKDLAEKVGITVSEQNFKTTGIHVESGLCKIKDQQFLIIDKQKPVVDKLQILSSVIATENLEISLHIALWLFLLPHLAFQNHPAFFRNPLFRFPCRQLVIENFQNSLRIFVLLHP